MRAGTSTGEGRSRLARDMEALRDQEVSEAYQRRFPAPPSSRRCGTSCEAPPEALIEAYSGDNVWPTIKATYCLRHARRVAEDARSHGFDVHLRAIP